MEVVLQAPGALFDGVEDEVGVSGVKSSVQLLGNGHQVKVLHPPHLEARLLSGPLELWVVRCHPVLQERSHTWDSALFCSYRPEHTGAFPWQQAVIFNALDWWSNTAEIRVVELCNNLLKAGMGLPICEMFALETIKPLPFRLSCCHGYGDKVWSYGYILAHSRVSHWCPVLRVFPPVGRKRKSSYDVITASDGGKRITVYNIYRKRFVFVPHFNLTICTQPQLSGHWVWEIQRIFYYSICNFVTHNIVTFHGKIFIK